MQSFIGLALVVSEKNGYKGQTDLWIYNKIDKYDEISPTPSLIEIRQIGKIR